MAATDEIIVAAPFEVFVAPVTTAFTDLAIVPTTATWVKLGINGQENMGDEGVSVQHGQTLNYHTPYGTTQPVKASRSEETTIFTFTLWDLTLIEYAKIMNDVTVAVTAAGAATAGISEIPQYRGFTVSKKAWLFKSVYGSAFGPTFAAQYDLPIGVVESSPTIVYNKTTPAALEISVRGIFDSTQAAGEEMGVYTQQSAVVTG